MITAMCVLTLTIFQLAIVMCYGVNGIIWYKEKQEFVELFSVPQFAAFQEENQEAKRRATEMHDMKDEVVKAVYYEEKNVVMFINNDTRITGICGDLWYLLADYLNFTFIPMKATTRNFGGKLENGSSVGLVGMLERNEAQVILKSEYKYKSGTDYTTPIWKSRYHIYIQQEWLYDNKWVFTLLSPITWYSIIFLYIIMSAIGYFLQKIPKNRGIKRRGKRSVNFSLNDHFFNSFAIMCSQGYIPDAFLNKFKILTLSKSTFAWLVMLAFNSNLIYHMTNREPLLPFTDLETLFNSTEYTLLVYRDSFFYNFLQRKYANEKNGQNILARTRFIEVADDMYNQICGNKKYAMFEIEDRYMALKTYNCTLLSIASYNETWITFALKRNLPYKRTIDIALLKLNEVGLIDVLKDRWLNIKLEITKENVYKTIDLHQLYLIFSILGCGILISLIVLVLEYIIHYYETKSVSRR